MSSPSDQTRPDRTRPTTPAPGTPPLPPKVAAPNRPPPVIPGTTRQIGRLARTTGGNSRDVVPS